MARCEPHVSCIKNQENISQIGLEQNVRERERREKKKVNFSDDFTKFCQS